jgi:hypothetical protein
VRGVLVGLVIGLAVGAGATYLALRPPWGTAASPASDATAIAEQPTDAGVAKPATKPRKRRTRTIDQPAETEETGPIELSAADRALEWRGDRVALPPQQVDLGAGGDARSLESGEIDATISNQTGSVRECVVTAATATDLRVTITIELLVDGGGRVTKSRLRAPRYLFGKGLLGCAQRALARLRFPATGAPTLVTFPVHLG